MIRLGGPIFQQYDSPETWVRSVQKTGYRAVYCPLEPGVDAAAAAAYAAAGETAGDAPQMFDETGIGGRGAALQDLEDVFLAEALRRLLLSGGSRGILGGGRRAVVRGVGEGGSREGRSGEGGGREQGGDREEGSTGHSAYVSS